MERTSIITRLYLADAKDYESITFIDGLPDSESLETVFDKVPFALERADFREATEDTDQGQMLDISIRANIYRDSFIYRNFSNKHVLAYLETANGEKHFFGSAHNPLEFRYTRDSGSTNSDSRDTTLLLGQKIPL
jgi:hypothetical protein